MMRSAILLILAAQSAAQPVSQDVQCSINAAQAADEMIDSIVYMWAAVSRCSTPDTITCEIDVTSAVQAVNGMVNVLVKALDDCGHLAADPCGMAAGELIQSTAGLASAAGGVVKTCHTAQPPLPATGNYAVAFCIVDVKDATRSLLRAVTHILAAEKDCKADEKVCAADTLNIISAFAAMSQYISGAIGGCHKGKLGGQNDINNACAEQASAFARFTTKFAAAATTMSNTCKVGAARLYEVRANQEKTSNLSAVTLSLFAFLPIVGLVAFSAGSRFAKFRNAQAAYGDLELINTEAMD